MRHLLFIVIDYCKFWILIVVRPVVIITHQVKFDRWLNNVMANNVMNNNVMVENSYVGVGGILMPMAKSINVENVGDFYPQHYYTYNQTLESLSSILTQISSLHNILLFAGEDNGNLYLQVGNIGHENYPYDDQSHPPKIVYGRKWRIDRDTPAPEIVQTALLAIQKVREHEVRELLVWRDPSTAAASTPFSCHQDVQLIAGYLRKRSSQTNEADLTSIDTLIPELTFGGRQLSVVTRIPLADSRCLLEICLSESTAKHRSFVEFDDARVSLVLDGWSVALFLHELMDALIRISDIYTENTFMFAGIQRFNRQVDPRIIGKLSVLSRPYKKHMADKEFLKSFSRMNYQVDKKRAPQIGAGLLSELNKAKLYQHSALDGHMPVGYQRSNG